MKPDYKSCPIYERVGVNYNDMSPIESLCGYQITEKEADRAERLELVLQWTKSLLSELENEGSLPNHFVVYFYLIEAIKALKDAEK